MKKYVRIYREDGENIGTSRLDKGCIETLLREEFGEMATLEGWEELEKEFLALAHNQRLFAGNVEGHVLYAESTPLYDIEEEEKELISITYNETHLGNCEVDERLISEIVSEFMDEGIFKVVEMPKNHNGYDGAATVKLRNEEGDEIEVETCYTSVLRK